MFKEVEKILAEFKPVAETYKAKMDKYESMEGVQYETSDEIEEFKGELEDKYNEELAKFEKKDEHRCKCCDSVLNTNVMNKKEVKKRKDEMWEKIDNHPKVKRLEEREKKEQEAFKALDKEIDKMSETIYKYEGQLRKALDKIDLPDSWFNFHTSLV